MAKSCLFGSLVVDAQYSNSPYACSVSEHLESSIKASAST